MNAPKRRRWPTLPRMPLLVDGQLTPDLLIEALNVLKADGPGDPMTLAQIHEWLSLHVRQPHPPSPSVLFGARGARSRRRYARPAGSPGHLRRTTAIRAA